MLGQICLFDGAKSFVIDKPIRLIELFAGYGSQHFALEYLNADFESYKICEWAVKSIQAYKDAHFKGDNCDYSSKLTKEQVFEYLAHKGISANYNEPMTLEQIKKLGEEKARVIYNNIMATNNLVNIQQVRGKDLEIKNVDEYCYIMTYSFPCQDLSAAGLGKGMEKGSGTRSGMLWEVERILDEIVSDNGNLPQVLLMENVPEVIGNNNIKHFAKWLEKLESLGYKNKWQVLNAKDYGVPQNRERCFMVSILGDYYYHFPQPQKLQLKLKDLLEENVDEKYYLSDSKLESISNWKAQQDPLKDIDKEKTISPCLTARVAGEEHSGMILINEDVYKYMDKDKVVGCELRYDEGVRTFKDNIIGCLRTLDACGDKHIIEPKVVGGIGEKKSNNGKQFYQQDRIYDGNGIAMCHPASLPSGSYMYAFQENNKLDYKSLKVRKLTPKEAFRLMGVKDKDFEQIAENQSDTSLYHLAGDSIVADVLMAIFKEML